MNQTNRIVLFAIFTFLLIYNLVLRFAVIDKPNTSTVTVTNGQSSIIDTLRYNNPYKLTTSANCNQKLDNSRLLFNQNPNFLLYIFFLAFFASTSLSLIFPLIDRTKKKFKTLEKKEVVIYSILSLLITIGIFAVCNYIPNAWHPQSIMKHLGVLLNNPDLILITLLSPLLILASICVFGILGVSSVIKKNDFSVENKIGSIQFFLEYKKLLDEYILIFGLFVASGAIILSSVLANTINDYIKSNSSIQFIPDEFVYLYGLAFTGAILIVYVPTYLKTREIGKEFISAINPIDYHNLDDWNKRNKTYLDMLDIAGNRWDGIKTSLKILSPIITSILASITKSI